jgi:SH3-like domain-containing protein
MARVTEISLNPFLNKTLFCVAALSLLSGTAIAAEYKQIVENGTILYDAPSNKGGKLFILGTGVPVEVIVSVAGWVKVRDAGGSLGWVEPKQLGNRTQVQVKAAYADVRSLPSESAPVVFSAERDVLLNLSEPSATSGWIKVGHRSGSTGFVRIEHLFGL